MMDIEDEENTAYFGGGAQYTGGVTVQYTTKIPPSYDGKSSWFSFEDAVLDWLDITELDAPKQGPALRNYLKGEAAVYKSLLDRYIEGPQQRC